MAEIRASFFVECEELLEGLQDALSILAGGNGDRETINVAFRAVHSIKGGAGAFGLDALVAFAHRFETVMDAARSDRLDLRAGAMRLFIHAADMLADHVRAARDGSGAPPAAAAAIEALEGLLGDAPGAPAIDEVTDFQPLGLSIPLDLGPLGPGPGDAAASDAAPPGPAGEAEGRTGQGPARTPEPDGRSWTVTFRPHAGLYLSGNEPLLLLRALCGLGPARVSCDATALPRLAELVPDEPCLTWTVRIDGDIPGAQIREVFDFVEDVADIRMFQTPDPEDLAPGLPGCGPSDPGSAAARVPPPASASLPVPEIAAGPAGAPGPARAATGPASPAAASPAPVDRAPAMPATPSPPASAAPPPGEAGATVRVDIERVDRLVNLVGELVINQAMLQQSIAAAGLGKDTGVMNGLEAFMMLTRDIQESVMMIRAQPVKPLFQRMARIVREASAAVGKSVRFRTEGEGTEVDKTVIERLSDPLTHMIRNAVDHGLEPPERRSAAGKPAEGVITLRAQHRSGRVVIEVADDGGGIDRARVLAVARAKGLVPEDAQPSDAEIDNLLFLPGFSTASTISNLSGRGVGMDVVRKAIQGLGGRVSIDSEYGKGTCFSISLPLTLAVLDGMVVRVAGETLVVPLSAILETATIGTSDLRTLGPSTHVIHVRGGFVPLYDLGVELGFRTPRASYGDGIVLLAATDEGSRAALVVDEIVEQRQVVIKGLHHSYGRVPGIAAATILGDGQIALILDPADLVEMATGLTRPPDFALAG